MRWDEDIYSSSSLWSISFGFLFFMSWRLTTSSIHAWIFSLMTVLGSPLDPQCHRFPLTSHSGSRAHVWGGLRTWPHSPLRLHGRRRRESARLESPAYQIHLLKRRRSKLISMPGYGYLYVTVCLYLRHAYMRPGSYIFPCPSKAESIINTIKS